jgi:methionine-rich copper-binding protein CopC
MAFRLLAALAACILALSMGVGAVSAHANLLHSNIKNNQILHVGQVPRQITGTFAEPLDPKQSWMAVFEGVADHGLVTEKQHSVVNYKNPKQMTLKLPKLDPDKYYLIWYTHSAADGHYAAGILYFQVVK